MLPTEVGDTSPNYCDIKGKGKVVPVPNKAPRHEDIWVNAGVAAGIINVDTR